MVVVVAHIVPSPAVGFDATQPGGRAGAVTASKFSTHGGPADGLGLADGVGVGVPGGVGDGVPLGVGDGTCAPVPRS